MRSRSAPLADERQYRSSSHREKVVEYTRKVPKSVFDRVVGMEALVNRLFGRAVAAGR